jgi:tRNA uridine 5-carboxymethylaminomethyl modification enzyme
MKLPQIVTRPQVSLPGIIECDSELKSKVSAITSDLKVIEQVEIQLKYAGYIEKEFEMVEEINRQEYLVIPNKINYQQIKSLSSEGVAKLSKIKPETIGQASRISGVTPSDIAVLMIYLKK